MRKVLLVIIGLLTVVSAFSQQTETIYSWDASTGSVVEVGGEIVQHNSLSVSRINYKSSGYHTIQLCGKKENLADEDNSLNSVYFTITLADGNTFKNGDKIEVTAMRNNDEGGNASIHFVYGNGTTYDDTNTWANLGQMHEMDFSGGIGAKGMSGLSEVQDAGTEPISGYDLMPSTNSFIVPDEADGSSTLTLTRNESECKLYITKISVTRAVTTGISVIDNSLPMGEGWGEAFSISGQYVGTNAHSIIIMNGKKIIK